jgi:hypothetical protein
MAKTDELRERARRVLDVRATVFAASTYDRLRATLVRHVADEMLDHYICDGAGCMSWLDRGDVLVRQIEMLHKWDHPASRPPRRMPSLVRIARHHGVELRVPFCWRCHVESDDDATSWRTASSFLERAHVIDRCYGGLDDVQNLRPLCCDCHRWQPDFGPGDEPLALRWFGAA